MDNENTSKEYTINVYYRDLKTGNLCEAVIPYSLYDEMQKAYFNMSPNVRAYFNNDFVTFIETAIAYQMARGI